MTSGSKKVDPKLCWAIDYWKSSITISEQETNNELDLNILSNLRNQVSHKKTKLNHVATELIVEVRYGDKLNKSCNLEALIDTGSSGCIILTEVTTGIHHKQSEASQQWMIKGGLFRTSGICPVRFYLPEFSTQECVKWNSHVDSSKQTVKSHYDMILGCDLLEQLPLDIKFSDHTMMWQEVTAPMKTVDQLDSQNIDEIVEECYKSVHLGKITQRTMEILDTKYKKADSDTIVPK
jgi:hypothetical protein